jgi:hypothetical protein
MSIGSKTGRALLALAMCAALQGAARADDVDAAASNGGNNGNFNNQFIYWAAVAKDGVLNARRGISSVDKTGSGQYVVTFKTNVTACLFNATITSLTGTFPVVGQIAVVHTANKAASVATFNKSGTGTDQDFYLVATCPPNE